MIAARKFSEDFLKKSSDPPPLPACPFCKDSMSVEAVSEAAAKLGMYFFCIG